MLLSFLVAESMSQVKSYKRGVSYGYHSDNDLKNFSPYISWWYNWSPVPESPVRKSYPGYNVDFVPMAWNSSGINGVLNWARQDTNIRYVLGFNEPNFKTQANMTPTAAAKAWPYLEAIADQYDLKLVSPAVNYCGDCVSENGITYTNPFVYLDDFFKACDSCRVDHIALHWYGGGDSMAGYIEEGRKYGKPIWVTEFAAWDNSVNNPGDQKKYLAGTTNFLERDPDVYRYAWFIGRRQTGQTTYPYIDLYGADGMLTELGELYMDIPVYDPDMKFQIPGRIEVEEYYRMSGLFAEPASDTDGFLNIGWTDVNDWAEYKSQVVKGGTYKLSARVAGTNPGKMEFLVDNQVKASLNTPTTGSWQSWTTVSSSIELEEGEHLLKMVIKDAGFNINWISITDNTTSIRRAALHKAAVFPNPVTHGILSVELSPAQPGGDYLCSLYSITGEQVYRKSVRVNRSGFQINLKESGPLNPGVYFLQISGRDFASTTKLLVSEKVM